jgi:hypothetical protein
MADISTVRAHTSQMLSMIPGATNVMNLDMEKLLTTVHTEDRVLVGNIIKTMHVLRTHDFISNIEIIPNKKGFDVIGTLSTSLEKELIISNADFEIIMSVNPVRISTVMVQVSNKAVELVVRVYSHDTPIVYNSVQVSHIAKKTRWF